MDIEEILQKCTARQLQVLRVHGLSLSAQSEALHLHKDVVKRHRHELHKLFGDLDTPAKIVRKFIKEHE